MSRSHWPIQTNTGSSSSARAGVRAIDPCKDVPEADIGFGMLVANVQAVMDEGEFAPKPAMLVAEAIWACLHGLVALLLTHPGGVESDHCRADRPGHRHGHPRSRPARLKLILVN